MIPKIENAKKLKVSILTGGGDKPYALGLLKALISEGVSVDFIGNDEMGDADVVADNNVNFLNLRGNQDPKSTTLQKIIRVLRYYFHLLKYAATVDSSTFHILWFNKFLLLDRTLLNFYYKLLGKRLVFTAHNVDEKERDGGNNFLHKLSLKISYTLMDHIFVHTGKMKSDLISGFGIPEGKISIIPFGINNTLPKSALNRAKARARLELKDDEKVLLFFGNIAPYKGLDNLICAMERLRNKDDKFRLIVAGPIKGCSAYWQKLVETIERLQLNEYIIRKIEYIPDEDVEIFFKSSDVLILPYRFIYQSGVLFLSYSFGLPVIATDVGSLREDIVEGKTGMICRAGDHDDLANRIILYFGSGLYKNLESNRLKITEWANEKYSWRKVGEITHGIYKQLI